ncbi:MAG: hypothetical protein IJY33_03290, partial [Oscillospiraceae bacterium]|nr:hypothetical protein [Oscillospiraceae bacterium]
KTCPNCKIAAALLDKAGVTYTKLYAEDEPEKATALGVKQAPTLIVGDQKFTVVSDIKKYIESLN